MLEVINRLINHYVYATTYLRIHIMVLAAGRSLVKFPDPPSWIGDWKGLGMRLRPVGHDVYFISLCTEYLRSHIYIMVNYRRSGFNCMI